MLNPLAGAGVSQSTPVREKMFEMAGRFVDVAKQIPGVRRIALIGSITDQKPEPKDLDLLVTVEIEFAPVATLATADNVNSCTMTWTMSASRRI